jgi:hypothetical protein
MTNSLGIQNLKDNLNYSPIPSHSKDDISKVTNHNNNVNNNIN